MSTPLVSELMDHAIVIAKPKDIVSKIISDMKDYKVWVVPVINENGKLVGTLSYRDLLERRISLKSKVSSAMSPPYSINQDSDLIKAMAKILTLKVRALPVVDSGMNLVGILTREKILRYLVNGKLLPRITVSSIMSKPAITIDANEAVARAKWLMIRHGITRLPVLESSKLYGIVSMRDIVERLYYASIPRRSRRGDVVGTEDDILAAPAKAIATTPVITVSESDDVYTAVNLMLDKGISGMPVISGESVVGVISSYDVIRAVIRPYEEIPVEAKLAEIDEDVKPLVEKVISNYIAKINRMTNVIDMKINIKKYEKGGEEKRSKYSVHIMLKDNADTYTVNEVDWDPVNAVRYAFETLIKRIEREINRTRDIKRRGRLRGGPPGE
ncbi:MAG: CBS domain-containing protein [Vulcanisaeta sp.]|jgi:CBS domain-containing protein|uniref:CBS domain containing protein n=1 Tax=Vulcanisaeta moutnovskia (strain 768-28) TaxID=985053 RepID=F0QWT1_VULM7|nr:CBS domain-containing protein [Vulcanisaeta moutnovskia]ADY02298.1 CBS domain containing protein [Vulcanisaeta moutnovskia 768-28]